MEPSSVEPLALQVLVQTRRSATTSGSSSGQPGDLCPSAAAIIGKSLEDAMDKMFSIYSSQHQGVKSLIQVIRRLINFVVHLYSPAPKCQNDS